MLKKQNNKKTRYEKKQRSLPFAYHTLMIPVVMGFLVPLVVRGYSFKISPVFQNVSLANGGVAMDVFLRGKQIWLYWTIGVALFLLLCFKLLERKIIYWKKWMIFGGIYLLCAFISALMAEDIKTAFFGGEDLFQGFFVLLAYFVLFYYIYMIFCGEKKQRMKLVFMFLRCALVLSLVFIILGSFQFCGNDPFSWEWVQKLCNISGAHIIKVNKIYLTLYNSNYVGVMTILLLPLLFVGMLEEKNRWMKVLYGIALMGTLGCLIASGSKTATAILAVIIIVASIIVIIWSKSNRKIAIFVLSLTIIICGVVIGANPDIIKKINQPLKQRECNLTGMSTESDSFKIEVDGQELSITWDDEGIKFVDEKGTSCETKRVSKNQKNQLLNILPLAMTSYYGESQFEPERIEQENFRKIIFFKSGLQYGGKNIRGYVFYINKFPYFITNEWNNKEYNFYNLAGKFVKIYNSEDAFGEGVYGFATGRGYIWSKTIPQLKQTIFWGVGMNHFSLLFPNHDYAAKTKISNIGRINNKPHNWYLQMGTESGVISSLCMIVMILYILIEGIKGCSKSHISEEKRHLKTILTGLGLSVLGYCLMNIFNDQMIVTAPVFWLVLGAYAGISYCLKEE